MGGLEYGGGWGSLGRGCLWPVSSLSLLGLTSRTRLSTSPLHRETLARRYWWNRIRENTVKPGMERPSPDWSLYIVKLSQTAEFSALLTCVIFVTPLPSAHFPVQAKGPERCLLWPFVACRLSRHSPHSRSSSSRIARADVQSRAKIAVSRAHRRVYSRASVIRSPPLRLRHRRFQSSCCNGRSNKRNLPN